MYVSLWAVCEEQVEFGGQTMGTVVAVGSSSSGFGSGRGLAPRWLESTGACVGVVMGRSAVETEGRSVVEGRSMVEVERVSGVSGPVWKWLAGGPAGPGGLRWRGSRPAGWTCGSGSCSCSGWRAACPRSLRCWPAKGAGASGPQQSIGSPSSCAISS